jgi:glycosyltransferase involved in cell wall biosynthesis
VTTRVGGNAEVVASEAVGALVPFWEPDACVDALVSALARDWNRAAIRQYAEQHGWDARIRMLKREFAALASTVGE